MSVPQPFRFRAQVRVAVAASVLLVGLVPLRAHGDSPAEDAAPVVEPLTNLSHLDFLGDTVTPPQVDGHTTYRLEEEPETGVVWTYADRRDGGVYERVGGGPYDEATDTWGQGAYNADDLTRAAVVYLRHWRSAQDEDSRDRAYQLLRTVAYLQTTVGEDAGNVVLWMQPDGALNPSPEPVELPDPSDSDESYWLARTVWALGEGYEAFVEEDPAFADFLEERLGLALTALNRSSLSKYGHWDVADGRRVPAWLITDAADASAEAVLGLAAYLGAETSDTTVAARAREALERYAEGVAVMSAGDAGNWPFGAVLQWTHSQSLWHAWASQMPAALGKAAEALESPDPAWLAAAIADAAVFTPHLLTSTGPINGWQPVPTDMTQIAYGVDSRLQSLLTVADVADAPGFKRLAALTASWYFGANRAGVPMYDPDTGRTYDGLNADDVVNQNSGAESTIHGLLSMLTLDAHPDVSAAARRLTSLDKQEGLKVVEAEAGSVNNGAEVVTPESAWTGESLWSGNQHVLMPDGASVTWEVPVSDQQRLVLPVVDLVTSESVTLEWSAADASLGDVAIGSGGDQGVTEAPGALLPVTLAETLSPDASEMKAVASGGGNPARLDAVLLKPLVSRLVLSGEDGSTTLLHNATKESRLVQVASTTLRKSQWLSFDDTGTLVSQGTLGPDDRTVALQPQGFAIVLPQSDTTPTATPSSPAPVPGPQPSSSPTPTRTSIPTPTPRPPVGLPSTGSSE